MAIEELVSSLLTKKGQAAMVAALKTVERTTTSNETEREMKKFIDILGGHLKADRRRQAMATMLALMITDAEYTIPRLRRAGLLRASKYEFRAACVANIVRTVLHVRHLLNARPDRFVYLESVLALTHLAPDVRLLHEYITTFLKTRRATVLKTLLVITNGQFYSQWPGLPDESPLNPDHYSAEETCESASLLLSMYRTLFELTNDCCNLIDEKAIRLKDPVYDKVFVAAARINKFKEAESLVDGLPYQATRNQRTVTISSIDPAIEKSVRLGYIQTEIQLIVRARRLSQSDAPPPIRDFVERGFGKGLEKTIEIINYPV